MTLTAYSAHFDINDSNKHRNIIRDAERVKSLVYCRSDDLDNTGNRVRITVMFTDQADLFWFKLKWA